MGMTCAFDDAVASGSGFSGRGLGLTGFGSFAGRVAA